MKIQFEGAPDSDDVADAFILAFVASRKGSPVTALQVWKSLRTRGFVPTDGRVTSHVDPDDGAATAEVSRRLQKLLVRGVIGGDGDPEALTGDRHFWVLGNTPGNR